MYDLKMNELNLVSGGNSENPPLGIFVDSQLWKDMLENARQLAQSISSASMTVIGNCANGAAVAVSVVRLLVASRRYSVPLQVQSRALR